MLRYGIDDIRLFYENDVRFLEFLNWLMQALTARRQPLKMPRRVIGIP
jgi:hypothetical protein